MLNKLFFNFSYGFVFSFLCLFLLFCTGKKGIKEFKDNSELNDFLISKGYIINTYGWKPGKQIKTIELRKTTKYSEGDFEVICSIPSLSILFFEGGDVPQFTKYELETCEKGKNLQFDFRRVKLSVTQLCDISAKMKNSNPSFYFTNTNVNDQMLDCLSKITSLNAIAIDDKFDITEKSICKLTANVKSITSFSLSEVSFSRKALDCIFSLPNLNRVSLQNWSKVPEEKIWELVHEYEDRHGRKLDAIIDDPTSIDSTVWPKNNN